ncbi:hypothetical protein DV737_g2394, partial [Chaetothyriales sp. CBS 132003]
MKSLGHLKNRANQAISHQPQQESHEHKQSLATLLSREQRADLTLLISQTIEEMRKNVIKTFDYQPPLPLAKPDEPTLAFFDSWAESVILRVGEAVNAREEAEQPTRRMTQAKPLASQQAVNAEFRASRRQQSVSQQLRAVYPPIDTPLASLGHTERSTILNAILLLLLSLEAYRSPSRSLLIRLAISLRITPAELTQMETSTAFGLLSAATKMDASSQTVRGQERSASSRKWKIGVAGVAGAALIGITGGLAAPLLAAGVGTLMGGLGLGATAAAGYLGALAGNAVLVGGLFGAYGARMTSKTMDKFSKEIEDFAFLPVRGSLNDGEEEQKKRRRLRVSIGITGWLTEEGQVVQPWRVLGDGGEGFALRWEVRALEELGSALMNFVKSQAWSQLRREVIKRTVLAAIYSAMIAPLAIRKAIKWVDSPFGIAKGRALKAGEVLADALIERVQGERPVSLVGQSLGARVIYSCLLALARRQAFGLVENVVMMGAAVPSDEKAWRAMRSVVSGRLINVYSSQDYILAFLYRASSAQLGVAGIQAIQGVSGVENVDLSQQVPGHMAYIQRTGRVLDAVGWEDIDEAELEKQEVLNRQVDKEAKEDQAKGDDPEPAAIRVEEKD